MFIAIALALSAQGNWHFAPGYGTATMTDATVTASGGGVATLQLPQDTKGSWRITFNVRAAKGTRGQQDIALVGAQTLFRLHFDEGSKAYVSMAQGENGSDVSLGDTWRRVQIYDIRGCLSFRYERKLTGATNLSQQPTSFVVGVPKMKDGPAPGKVEVKDFTFASVDESLTGVPRDVPVPTLSSWRYTPLQSRPFDVSSKPDVALNDSGAIVLLQNNIDLECPSGTALSFTPAVPAQLPFTPTSVGVIMDGQIKEQTRLKVGQSFPHYDLRLPHGTGGVHNFRYVTADDQNNETAVQYVHIVEDDAIAKHFSASTDQNGCTIKVDVPATTLFLYARGVFLGGVALKNGQVTVPAEFVPGGAGKWAAIAKSDKGKVWGPFTFDISSHRTVFKGTVIRSPWDPSVNEASITVTPNTSVQPVPKSMQIFANGALVQSGAVKEVNRTVLLTNNQPEATIRVSYTFAGGGTLWGGTARIQPPVDEAAMGITQSENDSVVLVQVLSSGWKSVGSGFFFSNGRTVATSSIRLKDQKVVRVVAANGDVYQVEDIVMNEHDGLALLKLAQDSGRRPLAPGTAPASANGAYVLQSKSIFTTDSLVHENLLLPVSNVLGAKGGLVFRGQLILNDLGAPVLDEKGQVIGILSHTGGEGAQSSHTAVSIEALVNLVQTALP